MVLSLGAMSFIQSLFRIIFHLLEKNPTVVNKNWIRNWDSIVFQVNMHKPFDNLICSPFGLYLKKLPEDFRIIHDLSFPEGYSVNEHASRANAAVHYDSIENVFQLITKFGTGALMAKLNIEDGFRNIPIHPSNYHFLSFMWHNQYY